MKKVTYALKCPSCSGLLEVCEGDTHTVCPSCSNSLLLSNAVGKFVLPSSQSSIDVLRSVRKKLQSINPRGADNAKVSRPILYYVPFWHCTAQVNGYVLGVEPTFRDIEIPVSGFDGQRSSGYTVSITRKIKTRTGSNAVEREIQISGSVNISGADLEPLGIPTLSAETQLSVQGLDIQRDSLPEGLEVLENEVGREGVFVDPIVSLVEAQSQTARYLRRLASGAGFGLEARWEYILVSGHREMLVYYPLWVTDFRFSGRTFQVVVDGRSGVVLRGRFPLSKRDKRILTIAMAVFWAGLLPILTDLVLSGKLDYRTNTGTQSSCIPVVILIAISLAYGTHRLLKILSELSRKGSEIIV
ncbi:MAG: hypothetical protein KAQ97_07865 [Candidatus Fermentibacteraceae bacterium]|nr:hypothetical protein [Candidatus Fermentibacteraceae bacterium]